MVSGVKTEMSRCYPHKTSNITGNGTETETEKRAIWTWGRWPHRAKCGAQPRERERECVLAPKKQLATGAVKSDERRRGWEEMKDREAEEWGSLQQTYREARIYSTGSRIVCHTHKKNTVYRSCEHIGFKSFVLFKKLNTTHLGQRNYQWTAPSYSNSYEHQLYRDF